MLFNLTPEKLQTLSIVDLLTLLSCNAFIIIHLLYVWALYFGGAEKTLRKRSLLFVHHFNFVNFLLGLFYLVKWWNLPVLHSSNNPNIKLSNKCCTFDLGQLLQFVRIYALLLVSVHRWTGVQRWTLFKLLNHSNRYICASIWLVWTLASILYVASTQQYLTSSSSPSPSSLSTIYTWAYQCVWVLLVGLILPTMASLYAHFSILKRLKQIRRSLIERSSSGGAIIRRFSIISSQKWHRSNRSRRNEMKQLVQFCLVSSFVVLSSLTTIVSVENNMVIVILRPINMFAIDFIPVLSLIFNKSFMTWLKGRIFTRNLQLNRSTSV